MARPHPRAATVVATLVTATALVAAFTPAPAGAQAPAALAGPRALAAAGALPRAAERRLRTEARHEAAAQPPRTAPAAQSMRFSLAGGLSQPSGDLGDFFNTGFNVTGSGDFRPANFPIGLRADVSYNRWTGDEDEVGEDVSLNLIGAQLNGVIRFGGQAQGAQATASSFRPYILGGVGAYRAGLAQDDDNEDEIVLGFGFGGGLEFRFGTNEAFLEARYQTASTDDTVDDGISFLPIVLGFRF